MFAVSIDDNFHHADEDERTEFADAVAAAEAGAGS
jgi:hypothetical protein